LITGKKYIVLNMENKIWKLDGFEVSEEEMMKHFGFVYLIKLSNGKQYLGKKQIKNFTYKQVNSYNSSNTTVKKSLITHKNVLQWATSKRELTYLETKYQFIYNVLEDDSFENYNILGKFYRGKLK